MSLVMCEQAPGYGPPTPVAIHQWEDEFEQLLDLYRDAAPVGVLEIGTYHGGTLYHWLQNARDGALVVALDSYSVGVDNRHLYEDWRPSGVTLEVIEGGSHDPATVARVQEFAPFDWIFIDAGHLYHEVRNDWEFYGPMAAKGGVVCFHDINPADETIEVDRLWREIKRRHSTEEIVGGHEGGGGIGVVHV